MASGESRKVFAFWRLSISRGLVSGRGSGLRWRAPGRFVDGCVTRCVVIFNWLRECHIRVPVCCLWSHIDCICCVVWHLARVRVVHCASLWKLVRITVPWDGLLVVRWRRDIWNGLACIEMVLMECSGLVKVPVKQTKKLIENHRCPKIACTVC